MRNFVRTLGVSGSVATLALVTLAAEPAWALVPMPGPAVGGLIGLAIIGALVAAKIWRRK